MNEHAVPHRDNEAEVINEPLPSFDTASGLEEVARAREPNRG